LIAVPVRKSQPPESFWRIHLHLDLVPLGFARHISRIEPDGVLVAQLERYPGADFHQFRLIVSVWKEGAAPGHTGYLFKDRAAKAVERVGGVGYPYGVDLHVRLFHQVAELLVCVAAVIVLAVRDDQQRFLYVSSL